jgi:hypothetical protein
MCLSGSTGEATKQTKVVRFPRTDKTPGCVPPDKTAVLVKEVVRRRKVEKQGRVRTIKEKLFQTDNRLTRNQ